MQVLPVDNEVNVNYLNEALDSMTTSYKIFCFKGIFDEVILDNYEISFNTLVCRMIENVWHPLLKYNLSFGKMDQLADIVQGIYDTSSIPKDINKAKLVKELRDVVNIKIEDKLLRYVIYRLIRPTFKEEIKCVEKDNDKQKLIKDLCIVNEDCIYRVDSENRKIIVNNKWFKYIKRNLGIIDGWLRFNLIDFLQRRNPNVPSIIYKLEAEINRELKEATKIWKGFVINNSFVDIYSKDIITPDDFEVKSLMSIDHFIPWSFIGHDMLWNLVPTNKRVNSSKSDSLPSFNEYFDEFGKLQYRLFNYLISIGNKKAMEDYLEVFSDLDINNVSSGIGIDEEEFISKLSCVIHPLYQIALNQGFGVWSFNEEIRHKLIEDGSRELV